MNHARKLTAVRIERRDNISLVDKDKNDEGSRSF